MATVTEPKSFNHDETQRKVRHPLQLVRRYIRRYVILEGLALTLLFASIFFWIGLAFDFGLYKFRIDVANIFGIDWIMELNDVDPTGGSSIGIRVILLATIVIALLVLGFSKVVTRWFREFNDRALALVLERRFPKELGDRLITAVELADPKLSKKYGYSQAMVEKTISECVNILKTLPVAGVFNWRRLYGLWFLVALSTFGVFVLSMAAFCGGSLFLADKPMSPVAYAFEFYDTGAIWTERNVLMMNTYWPRNAFLEIGRFQPSKEDANEMRVAKDDTNRPELQVRAFEWVIADRDRDVAPHGWRALTWKDLAERKLISAELLAQVQVPKDFNFWQLDPEELEPNLVAALFETATQERSAEDLRKFFQTPAVQKKIADRDAADELAVWLDWRNWKMDKIVQQMKDEKANPRLSELRSGADLAALDEIVAKLNELAESPSMSRTLRKLMVPEEVVVSFRGEANSLSETHEVKGNKATISLKELKESNRFRFRVRGDNYFTQPKIIALIPAPTPAKITTDKEEPAYIYHRMRGIDQMALRGEKHLSYDVPLSTTGDSNTIEVPFGSSLTVRVDIDNTPVTWGGVSFTRPTTSMRKKWAALGDKDAVAVSGVDAGSAGATAGFQVNDVVLAVNGAKVPAQLESFAQLIKSPVESVAGFELLRDGKSTPINSVRMPANVKYSPRLLRKERAVFPKDSVNLPEGFDHYRGARPEPNADRTGFVFAMTNVTRKHEFSMEFFDEDNIRGKRRFKILAVMDAEPQMGNLHVHDVLLRKPKFKLPERKDNDGRDPRDLAELANSFLITPDAIIPFECLVRDDYGLVRVGYDFKYRAEDFDLFSSQSIVKKPAPKTGETEPITRKAGAGAVLGLPLLAWAAQRADQEMALLSKYTDGYASAAGFEQLLERKNHLMVNNAAELKTRLSLKLNPSSWEFNFQDDRNARGDLGFDLRVHLPELKAVNLEQTGQTHYALKVAVLATDNNVETGTAFSVPDGKNLLNLRGNTKRNKNGYVNFLVVSENQLLSQIAIEEEVIFEKLEAAKEKVDAGLVSLSEQNAKVGDQAVDMENVLNRMNEIRTALSDAGSRLRDGKQAYSNIVKEMSVNRVRADRREKIEKGIVEPLANILENNPFFPNSGSYLFAEDSIHEALRLVERDVNNRAKPDVAQHRKSMGEADVKMQALSKDLKRLLDAMSEGIVEAKLIALLVTIEEQARKNTEALDRAHKEAVKRALEELIGGPIKKEPEKKVEPKKDEKKTTHLQLQLRDGARIASSWLIEPELFAWRSRSSPAAAVAELGKRRQIW